MIHDLKVEVVSPEDIHIVMESLFRLPGGPFQQACRHLALQARGEADEPSGVQGKKLLIYARLVVKSLEVRPGHQLQQVPVPFVITGQQHQVEWALIHFRCFGKTIARGHVEFTADYGSDACIPGRLVELNSAVHGAMIGYGNGRHSQVSGFPDKAVNSAAAVKERIFAMNMEMDEWDSIFHLFLPKMYSIWAGDGNIHSALSCRHQEVCLIK